MINLKELAKQFENCPCGRKHELTTKEVVVGSGIVKDTGEILKRNGFKKRLLLVGDKNTLRASEGVEKALEGFEIQYRIYDNLREATIEQVNVLKELLEENDGVISVGTGSLNDICRKAAADTDKPLCIFATAASMDGFASYGAPLTDGNFKATYDAKMPEVIIADTKILARAPKELKSAGFGDMIGKYVGLIDWQVSALISGEYYCEKVANLTREATDRIMSLADRITADDEESAAAVFEALLLTGIGMAFTKTSRPASGTEHILSHFWECKKLLEGKLSDFHGKKVGVATLLIMEKYSKLLQKEKVVAHKEVVDWEDVYKNYGELKDEVIKLNTPDTITDGINPEDLEKNWDKIRDIIRSVPSYEQIKNAMERAEAVTTVEQIEVSEELKEQGLKYHPYMRRRLSLYRLANMID
ncbi:MAG: sn-glycerol-1-phosphate dehydrogenase [Clostridiales bacterium]|nr:sn-glycerol-1-phosphate dehydrogenase [Clostridiales bacterium]